MARILEKHSCLIIADDIYEKIVYDDFRFHNLVALSPALRDRTIIVNGVSKTYAMTGWRIGYALGPADVISAAAQDPEPKHVQSDFDCPSSGTRSDFGLAR